MRLSVRSRSRIATRSNSYRRCRYLKPVIEREHGIVHKAARKIFVGGFSQGCGMALHCLYSTPDVEFAGIIGVSGYLFPITPFKK
jgi:phospholipase/carboxylesterase